MTVAQQIQEKISHFPEYLQRQVLDYSDYLSVKYDVNKDIKNWNIFSVASALRGMENEDTSIYDNATFKEKWQ